MATEQQHLDVANRTNQTIDHLLSDISTTSPWIATAAFYKALHIVEAVFFNDRAINHTHDHGVRESKLKTTRKYAKISSHFLPLFRASINARYHAGSNFDTYLPPDRVVAEMLKHHLHQVEQSAQKFLKNPSHLALISACANLPP